MPTPLSSSPAWIRFAASAATASRRGDTLRLLEAANLRIDLSAQAYSTALRAAANDLLAQQAFTDTRQRLYEGAAVNWTEHRAAGTAAASKYCR